jgi:hypothetical protein
LSAGESSLGTTSPSSSTSNDLISTLTLSWKCKKNEKKFYPVILEFERITFSSKSMRF